MGFVVLLLSSTEGWSLPPCPEDQSQRYHNCFGTYTLASGSKYVGEWMDGQRREQFVMANLSIFRQIWYFDIA